jgi:hypothetical protein
MKSLNILHFFQIVENLFLIEKKFLVLRKSLLITLILISPVYSQNPKQSIIDINDITLWIGDDGFHDWLINYKGEYFCNVYPKGTESQE